jgi:protein SCO1
MRLGDWIKQTLTIFGPFFAAMLIGRLAVLAAESPAPAPEIEIGAPFRLTDQNGVTRSDRDFRGAYMLVYFGYTFCPDSCPTALAKMVAAITAFAKRDGARAAQLVPIFISIDPARDTPALLKEYAAGFSPRLVALTGTPEALRDVAYGYGADFARQPGKSKDYLMDHTAFIYLMGPDGRYVTHFESSVTVDDIVGALTTHVGAPSATR